jgi:hypothetical protein
MRIWTIMLASSVSFSAWAECPVHNVDENYINRVQQAIKEAKGCDAGVEVAELCALDNSSDTQIALAAERKCGLDFWKQLSKIDIKAYSDLQSKCDRKFVGSTSSVNRVAFCRMKVAELYSYVYRPVDKE